MVLDLEPGGVQRLGLRPLDVEAVELAEQASWLGAIRSISPARLASVAVTFFAWVTRSWASFGLRP